MLCLSFNFSGSVPTCILPFLPKPHTGCGVLLPIRFFDDRFTVFDSRNGAVGGAKVNAVVDSVSHVQCLFCRLLALRHCDFSYLNDIAVETNLRFLNPSDDSFSFSKAFIHGEIGFDNHAIVEWFAKHFDHLIT